MPTMSIVSCNNNINNSKMYWGKDYKIKYERKNKMIRAVFKIRLTDKDDYNKVINEVCLAGSHEVVEWIISRFYPKDEDYECDYEKLRIIFFRLLNTRRYVITDLNVFISEVKECIIDILLLIGELMNVEVFRHRLEEDWVKASKVTCEYPIVRKVVNEYNTMLSRQPFPIYKTQ